MLRLFCVLPSLLLLGCATGPGRSYSPLLSAVPLPPPEQPCVLLEAPPELPESDELLVDLRLPRLESGHTILELEFDSLGNRTDAQILRTDWPREVQSRILAAVPTRLSTGATNEWGVLVGLTGGDSLTVQVGRMEACSCALLNEADIVSRLQRVGQRLANTGVGLPGTQHVVVVDVRTDSLGNVVDRRVGRIGADRRINEAILEVVSHMQIAPPLLNRRPQDAWSRMPLTMIFPADEPTGSPALDSPSF